MVDKERLEKELKVAQESRLRLMMYREDIVRHINKWQADMQIVDRDILAADGQMLLLNRLLGEMNGVDSN